MNSDLLCSGDIERIISQTSHGSMSMHQRIMLAQNIAQDIAKSDRRSS